MQPTTARPSIRGTASIRRAAPAVDDEDQPDRSTEQERVVARQRGQADEQTGQGIRATVAARPRPASQIVAATSGWKMAKFSGWAMNTVAGRRDRRQDAGADLDRRRRADVAGDGPREGRRERPDDEQGSADASGVGPRTTMNGAWRNDARGSQWAFEGMGRVGSAGRWPPTSAKIQMKSTLRPWPAARDRARRRRSTPSPGTRGPGTGRTGPRGPRRRARTTGQRYARPVQRSTGSGHRRPVRMGHPVTPRAGL